jgi:hypothetical protein
MDDDDGFMSEDEFAQMDNWYDEQALKRREAADTWEQAERDALVAQRAELVRNERAMIRTLVKVNIGLVTVVLASAWLWMRLTGRI